MSDANLTVLGLDIGGTKTAALLTEARTGETLFRTEVATRPRDGLEASLGRVFEACEKALAHAKEHGIAVDAIGVTIGGPLDVERGIIYSPPNLPGWDEVHLKEMLEARYALPVVVEHDGMAGALAERLYGAAQGVDHVIFLTMGTGLGAGMILNGRPYRGKTGAAGSVGHVRMAEDGPVAWGKAGSWEAFSSGSGIASLARWKYPERFPPGITAKDVAEKALQGDPKAEEVLAIAADYLGRGIAMLIDVINPEMIVLGSLATRLGDRLLGPAMKVIEREAEPTALAGCRICPSALGERLGDLAPAAAVVTRLEQGV